jgi:hypothetical protein
MSLNCVFLFFFYRGTQGCRRTLVNASYGDTYACTALLLPYSYIEIYVCIFIHMHIHICIYLNEVILLEGMVLSPGAVDYLTKPPLSGTATGPKDLPKQCKLFLLPLVASQNSKINPIAEGTTYFRHRTLTNRPGTDLQVSTLSTNSHLKVPYKLPREKSNQ